MLKIIRTNSENEDFRELVGLLDRDLSIRDGAEHAFYAQFNKIDMIAHAVVAYQAEEAVGCGAFKKYDDRTVEIKRMYVRPESRSAGIGAEILKELEKWAVEDGFSAAVLETGKKQPEAIRLYQKSDYSLIPNYGQYEGVENSVCMKKYLTEIT
ncbi:MAG: GNAT family N-acetyltransferase [Pyrinomonadaceae bacterium]